MSLSGSVKNLSGNVKSNKAERLDTLQEDPSSN